jgi:hypothetical protein
VQRSSFAKSAVLPVVARPTAQIRPVTAIHITITVPSPRNIKTSPPWPSPTSVAVAITTASDWGIACGSASISR